MKRKLTRKRLDKHLEVLNDLLGRFYTFLERKPQPTDQEVRQAFLDYKRKWITYCRKYELTSQIESLFIKEVALTWEKRYTTGTKTQK